MTQFYLFLSKIDHLRRINRLHSVGMCIAAAMAALIYVARDHVIQFVDSYDICMNRIVYNTSYWIFPKIVSHCNFITAYSRQEYPEFYVVILIDIWVAMIGILFFVYFLINLKKVTAKDIKIVRELQKEKNARMWFAAILYFLIFLVLISFTFIHMYIFPHTTGPFGWPDMMSSRFGVGPAIQTILSGMLGYTMFMGLIYVKAARASNYRPDKGINHVGS